MKRNFKAILNSELYYGLLGYAIMYFYGNGNQYQKMYIILEFTLSTQQNLLSMYSFPLCNYYNM